MMENADDEQPLCGGCPVMEEAVSAATGARPG